MTPPFTSWPWKIERSQKPPHHLLVLGSKGQTIGLLFVDFPEPKAAQIATADLVKCAPELYDRVEKLAQLLNAVGVTTPETDDLLARAGGRRE